MIPNEQISFDICNLLLKRRTERYTRDELILHITPNKHTLTPPQIYNIDHIIQSLVDAAFIQCHHTPDYREISYSVHQNLVNLVKSHGGILNV